MKLIFTLTSTFLTLGLFGQNYTVNTLKDTDSMRLTAIYSNPTVSNTILAVEESLNLGLETDYHLFSVDQFGNYQAILNTQFDVLRSKPIEYNGYLVFSAEVPLMGVELIAFDGTNTLVIDVEQGAIGSNPYNFKIQDSILYFSALRNGEHQVFSYSFLSGLQQLTNETGGVVLSFVSEIEGDYYYSKFDTNNIIELRKLTSQGVVYTLRSTDYAASGWFTSWASVYKSGNRILISEDETTFAETNLRILGTTDFINYDTLIEENLTNFGFASELQIINGEIFANLNNHYYVYNGGGFDQFYPSLVHDLIDLYFFENSYYGIVRATVGEPEMIYKFENGIATELYSNRHLHLLLFDNHDAYFSDWNPDPTMPSGIVRMAYDQIDTIQVSLNGIHSPVFNSALLFDGKFTFLFSNNINTDNTDIMQIDGLLELDELQTNSIDVFPNPIQSGSMLTIKSTKSTPLNCFDAIGNLIKTVPLVEGINTIDLSNLSIGTYFLKVDELVVMQIIE